MNDAATNASPSDPLIHNLRTPGLVDKAERRSLRERRRSSEGRHRAPLSLGFPQVQHHQIGAAMLNDVVEEVHDAPKEVAASSCHAIDSDGVSTISTSTRVSMRSRRQSYGAYPILTIEEATSDGHGA